MKIKSIISELSFDKRKKPTIIKVTLPFYTQTDEGFYADISV